MQRRSKVIHLTRSLLQPLKIKELYCFKQQVVLHSTAPNPFQCGSQRSYVTSNLSARLNLKPVNKENLHLNTFGDNNYRNQKCDVVKLCLETGDNKLFELTALKFPAICSPLPNKINVTDFPHLDGLEFADQFDGNDSVDVLVGSHYYWDIVSGKTVSERMALPPCQANLVGFCLDRLTIKQPITL